MKQAPSAEQYPAPPWRAPCWCDAYLRSAEETAREHENEIAVCEKADREHRRHEP